MAADTQRHGGMPSEAEKLEAEAEGGPGANMTQPTVADEAEGRQEADADMTAGDASSGSSKVESPKTAEPEQQRSKGKIALIMGSLCVRTLMNVRRFVSSNRCYRWPSFWLPSTLRSLPPPSPPSPNTFTLQRQDTHGLDPLIYSHAPHRYPRGASSAISGAGSPLFWWRTLFSWWAVWCALLPPVSPCCWSDEWSKVPAVVVLLFSSRSASVICSA